MTNNSFFSAANKALTTNNYLHLMDHDTDSLSLHYLDHQRELHIFNRSKTAKILFLPKFSSWGLNLK
jgi:hypothetical protein